MELKDEKFRDTMKAIPPILDKVFPGPTAWSVWHRVGIWIDLPNL